MSVVELFFWIGVGALVYTYLGYPLLVRMAAWLRRDRGEYAEASFDLPFVTVLVVAYNEEASMRGRIENLLRSDYPADRLQILVASDGSNDATAEVARASSSRSLEVVAFADRRGKSAVLNQMIPQARGEIVVLADVRQRFEASALRLLVDAFRYPDTGAVSGELVLGRPATESDIARGGGVYWRYEKFIRRSEARLDSTVGCTGAIYAVRRDLFKPIPESMILDDVLIPMLIARQGYRLRFESRARAHDSLPASGYREFARKVRTIAGNFQLFHLQPWLLNPAANRLWLQTVSHKGGRLVSPLFLGMTLALDAALATTSFFGYLLVAQLVFYGLALLGYAMRGVRWRPFFLSIPYTFCLLNAAAVVAFVSLVGGRQSVTWDTLDERGVSDAGCRSGSADEVKNRRRNVRV